MALLDHSGDLAPAIELADNIGNQADPSAPPPVDPTPPEPQPEPTPQRRMVPEEIMINQITPLRSTLRQTENELAETRRKLAEQNALLERLQRNDNGTGDPAQTPPAPVRPPVSDPQTDIQRAAAELVFQRDAQTISDTAYKAYGQDWVNSISLLNSFGLNSGEFVSSVMDVVGRDKTHEIMHAIAQEPEKAASLASMTPARRIAEITRISMNANAKAVETPLEAPKPVPPPARIVSRAPNPSPRVEPGGVKVVPKYDDSLSDEEFDAQFHDTMRTRSARR